MVQSFTPRIGARLLAVASILSGLMLTLSGCMAPYAGGGAEFGGTGPMAAFSATPTSGTAPLAVSFNGTTSRDPQGLPLTFAWDFGDGAAGTGVTPSHTYADDGLYTVTLVARNSYGVSSSPATRTIVVGNPPPVGAFTWSGVINGDTPVVNEVITFDASASVDPAEEEVEPKAAVVQYRWEFGDSATTLGKRVTHAYATAGNKAVRLEVTDDDGAIDVYVQTVAIGGGGSLEGVSPLEAAVHTPVTLTGTGFGPGTGESHVRCADREAPVILWSDTQIVVHLPLTPTRTQPVAAQWTVVVDDGVDPIYEVTETDPGLGFHVVRGILFASDRTSEDYDIYVMNPDGTNPTRLTYLFGDSVADYGIDYNPGENFLFAPAWSPDGTRVAFERLVTVGQLQPQTHWGGIYVMSADGSGVNRLTPDPRISEERHQRDPVWSADGTTIAFSECWSESLDGMGFDLWVMDPDGTDQDVLIDWMSEEIFGGSYFAPAYSPDGFRIAYAASPQYPMPMSIFWPDIAVANADGTSPVLLGISAAGQLSAGRPTWSPDGTKIAFEARYLLPAETDYEICVVDADGTDLRRLTTNAFNDEFPAWSPDGTKIAFASDRDGDYEIYVMNADGTGSPVNLTNDPTCDDKSPAWGIGGH